MAPPRRTLLSRFLLLTILSLAGLGCSTTAPTGTVLFEDARGTVSLQQIPHQSFESNHPIILEPALIARILSGVQIEEQQRVLQKLLAGGSSAAPVFSAEDVQFLAPLLAMALSKAAMDQLVGFQVRNPHRAASPLEYSNSETTAGSLYLQGSVLYFSLSQYRYAPARTGTENVAHGRLPDSTGLHNRMLLFSPRLAQRSDSDPLPGKGASSERFLAIDYQLLRKLPPVTGTPEQPWAEPERMAQPNHMPMPGTEPPESPSQFSGSLAKRDEEIRLLKDLVIKKDLELEVLRKELQSIRRQLDDRVTPQDSNKRKNKPSTSRPEAGP